jgi:hypothetical protein
MPAEMNAKENQFSLVHAASNTGVAVKSEFRQ